MLIWLWKAKILLEPLNEGADERGWVPHPVSVTSSAHLVVVNGNRQAKYHSTSCWPRTRLQAWSINSTTCLPVCREREALILLPGYADDCHKFTALPLQ